MCAESGERRTLRDLREVTQATLYVSKGLYTTFEFYFPRKIHETSSQVKPLGVSF